MLLVLMDVQETGLALHILTKMGFIFCRVAETRSLLYNIIYKKAQLQLMNVKCKILLVFLISLVFSFFRHVYSFSLTPFKCRKDNSYLGLAFRSVKW